MKTLSRAEKRVMGGGAVALLLISLPLWRELHEPGNLAWNVFLALFCIGLWIVAFALQRHFRAHAGEIGEARFDTRNKTNG